MSTRQEMAAFDLRHYLDNIDLYSEPVNDKLCEELDELLYGVSVPIRYELLSRVDTYGSTLLHDAAHQGLAGLLKTLLYSVTAPYRVKLLLQLDCSKSPVLQRAAVNGHTEAIQVAVESVPESKRGRLLCANDPWKSGTALHVAAYKERIGTMECLLGLLPKKEQQSYLYCRNSRGETAEELVRRLMKVKSVKYLKNKNKELDSAINPAEAALQRQMFAEISYQLRNLTQSVDSCTKHNADANLSFPVTVDDRDADGNENVEL